MELRYLQALIAVAETGSFSAAADTLGTVQSNVSAHVAKLERELGATLIERSGGKLTPEGEIVISRSYRVMSELDALTSDLGALREEVAGVVRAGMIGTTARWLVPMVLSTVGSKHPKLRLVISEGSTLQLEPQLAAGRLDLAVLTYPVPGKDLSFESLFEEELVFVTPIAKDPFRDHQRLSLVDLGSVDLLLPAQGTPYRAELDAALRPAGVKLRPLAELDGVRLLASLTFEGFGPSVLPATAVSENMRPLFRMIPIDGLPKRRVGLALRSRGLPSAPARAVVSELKRLATSQRRLPQGLHAVLPESVSRAEGSWRSVGVPNG